MYRTNDMWDEALQAAKFLGGTDASKRVAYAYALHLGINSGGPRALSKMGLLDQAIEYATETGAFDHAFELARDETANPNAIAGVHLKYAMFLEDEDRLAEAEDEFLKAKKPKEAIDMYIHQQSWDDAIRIANQYDPTSTPD
eukprot:2995869-Ditylum_brightwellii.AAC.1